MQWHLFTAVCIIYKIHEYKIQDKVSKVTFFFKQFMLNLEDLTDISVPVSSQIFFQVRIKQNLHDIWCCLISYRGQIATEIDSLYRFKRASMSHVIVLTNCSYVHVFLKTFTIASNINYIVEQGASGGSILSLFELQLFQSRDTNPKFRKHWPRLLKEIILRIVSFEETNTL